MKRKNFFFGFSLLEVMVSLAVVSIGALGYVKSQVTTLKNVSDIMARTVANTLLEDMASRMQANPAEVWLGSGSAYLTTGALVSGVYTAGAYTTACNGGTTICTAAQMASNDLKEWTALVASSFPAAMAAETRICLESTPGTYNLSNAACGTATNSYPLVFTIKIYWKSSQNSGAFDQAAVTTVEAPLARIPTFPLPGPSASTGSGQYK